MIASRHICKGFSPVLVAAAICLAAPGLAVAQGPEAAAATRQATPPQPSRAVVVRQKADQIRQDFYATLDQYPPALGRVLRLDPTLMTNEAYLASYPNLAAFVAQNPDIPRNPAYYLERYESTYSRNEPEDPRGAALRMWRDALDFLAAFAVFCVSLFAVFSLIKYVVEYRRWARISKVNAEVHNKILDRFGSNEELLAYVDSPAGRRFLEATPIAPNAPPSRSVGAPFGRILISVQIGVILVALAVGFVLVSGRAIDEVQPVLSSLAALSLCLGLGSIVSAGASYALSRKLGLLEDARPRPEHIG
jgi:hypothetical protein